MFSFHRPETLGEWLRAEVMRRAGQAGAPAALTLKGVLIRPVQPRLSLAERLAAYAPMPSEPTEALAWEPTGAEVIP